MGLALMIGGITANIIRLKVPMPWKTFWVLKFLKTHKYFGWGIVLVSQFVIGTGFVNFYSYGGKDTVGWGIAGASCALFFVFLIAGEVRHQILLRKEVPLVVPEATMN